MLILAFDTTIGSCSVTISKNRKILSENIVFKKLGSSEIIMPMLQNAISKTKTLAGRSTAGRPGQRGGVKRRKKRS